MNNNIVCPNCESNFNLDDSGLAYIIKQVRDEMFEDELKQRLSSEVNLAKNQTRETMQEEINNLKSQIKNIEFESKEELSKEVFKKQKEIDLLNSELSNKEALLKIEIENLKKDKESAPLCRCVTFQKLP